MAYKFSIFIFILKLRYMSLDISMIYPKSQSQQVAEWQLYLSLSILYQMPFTVPLIVSPAFYFEMFQFQNKNK